MKIVKRLALVAGVGLWVLASAGSPNAQAMGPARSSNACEVDMSKYCLGILEQGHLELVSCLKEHEKDLNSECREAINLK